MAKLTMDYSGTRGQGRRKMNLIPRTETKAEAKQRQAFREALAAAMKARKKLARKAKGPR